MAKADMNKGTTKASLLSDAAYIQTLRDQMLRFATLQLSDGSLAEDAVQEALMGALKNAESFHGKAALKTWVFAILKNKLADLLRKERRLVTAGSLLDDDRETDGLSNLFNHKGFWRPEERPEDWGSPHEAFREGEFWRVFEICLDHLPAGQARVFMMREFVELESREICTAVGVTTGNLNVMLHRARLRLRECLENSWFAGDGE